MQRRNSMIELKCPNCNADIELDDSRELGFCRYCGTKILIERNKSKIDGIANVESLLKRAKQFLDSCQVSKAEEYYNKVLDIEPDNQTALAALNKIKRYNNPYTVINNKPSEIKNCNCPTCNKQLQLDKVIGFIVCPVCGTNVTEKSLEEQSNFAKQLRQAPQPSSNPYDQWLVTRVSEARNAIQNLCQQNRLKGYISGYFISGEGADYGRTPEIVENGGTTFLRGDKEAFCKCLSDEIKKLGFEKFLVKHEYSKVIEKKHNGYNFWGTEKYKNEEHEGYKIYVEVYW